MNSQSHSHRRLFDKVCSVPPITSSWCVFSSLIILSALSCILGTFYDDEIFNIRLAALPFSNLIDFIKYINSNDIHPPASYVLNKLTFDAVGSWKAVQFVNGILNAAAITLFFNRTLERIAKQERLLLTFALATAVTSEMWGTSLRWNAYFNPVYLVLYTVALSNWLTLVIRATILAIGTVFLFYTSYLTLVAAPVLWGTFLIASYKDLRAADIGRATIIFLVAAIACLPQFYILLTVHFPNYINSHSFSVAYSIVQSAAAITVGNTVFPIDYIPALFLILLGAACVSSLPKILHDYYVAALLYGTLFGFTLLSLLRFGVEGRNSVFLYPVALTLFVLAISRSASWVSVFATMTLVLLQIISVYNFVFHRDTAKGSFNTPFPQAVREISSLNRACAGKTYVFTHDPVLTYLVVQAGGRVSSPYVQSDATEISVHEMDCVLVIDTYRGVLPPKLYAQFINPLSSERLRNTQTLNLGYDRFHAIKTWLGNETFPEYYITIKAYEALRDVSILDWYHLTVSQ